MLVFRFYSFVYRSVTGVVQPTLQRMAPTSGTSTAANGLEKLHGGIGWSDVKSVFAVPSYEAGVRRFESVLNKIEHQPSELQTYVEQGMENFDRFAAHLRDEAVPSTTDNLERY